MPLKSHGRPPGVGNVPPALAGRVTRPRDQERLAFPWTKEAKHRKVSGRIFGPYIDILYYIYIDE